jgi:hypothetical protein
MGFMEVGPHWVGKVLRVTEGSTRENNAASSGGDCGFGGVSRVLHSND